MRYESPNFMPRTFFERVRDFFHLSTQIVIRDIVLNLLMALIRWGVIYWVVKGHGFTPDQVRTIVLAFLVFSLTENDTPRGKR